MDAPPLDLIEAARDAGYDGLGLRLYPSPALPYHPVVGDAPLIRQMQRQNMAPNSEPTWSHSSVAK